MKGDPKVIAALMSAASMEASLSLQYALCKRDLRFQGLDHLAAKFACFAKATRQYATEITDRILYLGGDPEYVADKADTDISVTETLQNAFDRETAIVAFYNESAIVAMEAKDDNTRNKFEHWIKWHEDNQIDWLARQLAQIAALTEPEYIKIQLSRG